ncbi:hypothetical protein CTAYLR_010417 [Chrysophaeum taylorii]|uniref:Calpain catalytic domain-containing protein n=1 Tax=Chrysophaeum taylorii TaxID=2483200 RepID=A0AAD7UHX5_9STRA|nr:hypothetical protein CTAYLR_010417 [Chrysophaeum taylorii]
MVIDLTPEDENPVEATSCADEYVAGWEVVEGDDCDRASGMAAASLCAAASQGGVWHDLDFPETLRSIEGDDKVLSQPRVDVAPRCRCGQEAGRATVSSDTPNKGRAYWHCGKRRCAFFAWCDGGSGSRELWKRLAWRRPPSSVPICTDYGFSAGDINQGKLGVCWIISALSVVAERHDLISRLFADTARSPNGAHGISLFLDGVWQTVVVSDALPTTADGGLAFARSCDALTGRQTLWASLLEKALAKSYGSYVSAVGGQIAEALQVLTGASTLSINIPQGNFTLLERLWTSLERWKNADALPMGCATDNETVEGLLGSHAYSILAVKAYPEGRLLRVRDPHGFSHFPAVCPLGHVIARRLGGSGDECDRALTEATRTGEGRGTFFIDFAHFVAAFSRVDVSLAWRDHHARSIPCNFPRKKNASRACAPVVRLANPLKHRSICVGISAVQPSKRGSWCRGDRKKSYKPGDISLVVTTETGVVAASFQGAEVGNHASSCVFELSPLQRCEICCYSLGRNPAAAKETDGQEFFLRVTADAPLRLAAGSEEATSALHAALVSDWSPPLEPPPRRDVVHLSDGVSCVVCMFDGLVAVVARNASAEPVAVEATVFAKSAVARSTDAYQLLESDKERAADYAKRAPPDQFRFHWPAKWKCFVGSKQIPAESKCLVLVVARSGVQWYLGDIDCRIAATSPAEPARYQSQQSSIASWAKKSAPDKISVVRGVFAPAPLGRLSVEPSASRKRPRDDDNDDHHLKRALELSLHDSAADDDAQLRLAIDLSLRQQHHKESPAIVVLDEDDDLRTAMQLSLQPQQHHDDDDDDDDDLRRALELSAQQF